MATCSVPTASHNTLAKAIAVDELWRCQVCKSFVRRDRMLGPCRVCKRRTCTYCYRVCDKCLRIVCMEDIETKEVWVQGTMTRMKLCEGCRTRC